MKKSFIILGLSISVLFAACGGGVKQKAQPVQTAQPLLIKQQ